jgi:hypothetical protein
MTNPQNKMIGRTDTIDHGPAGGRCPCCGDAPGKRRKEARRAAKRAERAAWKAEVMA